MAEPLPETLQCVGQRCASLFVSSFEICTDETRPQLEELVSRFKIWAGNIGLFANGRAGIDYRFESDTGARDVLFSMLLNLSRALQRVNDLNSLVCEMQSQSSLVDQQVSTSATEDAIDSASEESSLSEDSAAESDGNTTEIPAIKAVENIVNQLYKILKLVKSPTSSGEYAKVTKFASQHFDEEEEAGFETWIRFYIKKEMPFAAEHLPDLVSRFANAALYRRWRLRYKKEHARKIRGNVEELLPSRPDGGVPTENPAPLVTGTKTPAIVIDHVIPPQPKVPFTAVSHTEASTVRRLTLPFATRSAAPTIVTQSGIMRRGRLDIPPAPNTKTEASHEIVCPYCSQIISSDYYGTSKANKAKWARHVVQDCSPYVCLFVDCNMSLTTQYSSQDEWLQHMLWGHAQRYNCKAVGHQDHVFDTEEDFRNHLSKHHNEDMDSSEVEEIVRRAIVPTKDLYKDLQRQLEESLEDNLCILCGNSFSEFGSSLPQVQSSHAPEMASNVRIHLATHLEELGFLSLPANEDDGSGGADSNASANSPTSKARNFEGLLPVQPCNSFENVLEDANYIRLFTSTKDATSEIPDLGDDRLMFAEYHGEHDTSFLDKAGEILPQKVPPKLVYNWPYLAERNSHKVYDWQSDPILLRFNEARKERSARVSKRWQAALHSISHHTFVIDAPSSGVETNVTWRVPFKRNRLFLGQERRIQMATSVVFNKYYALKRLAVAGLGGTGKTQFVLELLFRIKEQHQNCSVVWLRSTSIQVLQQECFDIVNKSTEGGGYDRKECLGMFLQTYLSIDDVQLPIPIVVFDGVDDLAVVDHIIDNLAKCKTGVMLFTTRDRRTARKFAPENVIEVPPMEKDTAFQFLQTSVKSPLLSSDRIGALLSKLNHIPLAIAQVSAHVNDIRISLDDEVKFLDASDEVLANLLIETFEDKTRYHDSTNALFRIWESTFDQMKHENPLAAEYLLFLACMAPSDIPLALLPLRISRSASFEAIRTLSAFSIITLNRGSGMIDMDVLVHLAVRSHIRRGMRTKYETVQAMVRLEEVFPLQNDQNRPLWSKYLPHALHLLEKSAHLSGMDMPKAKLSRKVANCLNLDGKWDDAARILEPVLKFGIERLLASNSRDSFEILASRATTFSGQGREYEAETLRKHVISRRALLLGENHPETLNSRRELAETYRNQGRLKEAEMLGLQVLEAWRDMHRPKEELKLSRAGEYSSMTGLAETYRMQGRTEEAEDLVIQAMEGQRCELGVYHPDTLASISCLALVWKEQAMRAGAICLMAQCVLGWKHLLGREHPDTVASYVALREYRLSQPSYVS